MSRARSGSDLFEGDYVVCADGTGSVSASCEIVTIDFNVLNIVNNVDLPGTVRLRSLVHPGVNEVQTVTQCSFNYEVTGGIHDYL
ncbi:MAG: hypothetical protein R3A46_07800 [Thermomicrobiales bacterium]